MFGYVLYIQKLLLSLHNNNKDKDMRTLSYQVVIVANFSVMTEYYSRW